MFPLQDNEEVRMYVRRHWIWLLLEVVKSVFLFIIPVLILIFIQNNFIANNDLFFNYPINSLINLFFYIWAIFVWLYFADRFTKYALNFWVLTNKRLVESEHIMLFSRKLSTLPLETIEDVTVKYEGLLENVIGFGSLTVQTAGTQREFLADDINDPEKVKQAIFNSRESMKVEDRNVTIENTEDMRFDLPIDQLHREEVEDIENLNSSIVNNYDWAHVDEDQKNDNRNNEEIFNIEDEYKKGIENALKYK